MGYTITVPNNIYKDTSMNTITGIIVGIIWILFLIILSKEWWSTTQLGENEIINSALKAPIPIKNFIYLIQIKNNYLVGQKHKKPLISKKLI